MTCPFKNYEYDCNAGCALFSEDNEECAILMIGEGIREIAYAADDANFDCGIRVHVTREEAVKID